MTLPLRSMTIDRMGDMKIRVTPGSNHCGAADGVRPDGTINLRYALRVRCAPQTDERGFLFDQAAVDRWLRAVAEEKPTSLSCELLARDLAERFMSKLVRERPTCALQYVSLRLAPFPYKAGVTVEYGIA